MSRICGDVECVNCGKVFRQSRWWQVACSERCRVIVNNNRTSELRKLTREVKELENRVKQAEIEAAQYYEDHLELKKLRQQMEGGCVPQWED